MKVSEVIKSVGGEVAVEGDLSKSISGCYVSDLLSDVLSSSLPGQLWVTQHTHANIVAVASVKEISAIIIVGGKDIAEDTLGKARAEKVTIIRTPRPAFEVAGAIYSMLNRAGGEEG